MGETDRLCEMGCDNSVGLGNALRISKKLKFNKSKHQKRVSQGMVVVVAAAVEVAVW